MIDVVKRTPKIYRDESRDFQVLARLQTALFNLSKMYADDLKIWESNIDNKLITLRSRTLNFINRHLWELGDLEAITSCFKYLMRKKGTEFALESCVNILMKSRGIDTGITIDSVVVDRSGCINIWVVNDKVLDGIMDDLVRYLIPTGLVYRIYNYDLEVVNAARGIITDIYYRQDYIVKNMSGSEDAYIIPKDTSEIMYPFTQVMLINDFKGRNGIRGYGIDPTSRNFGEYGAYITNTFVYTGSEGEIAITGKFRRPFVLYVQGYTLYCYPEEDEEGNIVAPIIEYDDSEKMLIFRTDYGTFPLHYPRDIIFPYITSEMDSSGEVIWHTSEISVHDIPSFPFPGVDDSEGTLIWNQKD